MTYATKEARLQFIVKQLLGLGVGYYWVGQDRFTILPILREAARLVGEDLTTYGIGNDGELIPLSPERERELQIATIVAKALYIERNRQQKQKRRN